MSPMIFNVIMNHYLICQELKRFSGLKMQNKPFYHYLFAVMTGCVMFPYVNEYRLQYAVNIVQLLFYCDLRSQSMFVFTGLFSTFMYMFLTVSLWPYWSAELMNFLPGQSSAPISPKTPGVPRIRHTGYLDTEVFLASGERCPFTVILDQSACPELNQNSYDFVGKY